MSLLRRLSRLLGGENVTDIAPSVSRRPSRSDGIFVNKWTEGKAGFDLSTVPPQILAGEGTIPVPLVLDDQVGPEMAILWIDHTPFIYDLARIKPFVLKFKIGLLNTSYGPVLFMLFIVDDPNNRNGWFAVNESYMNLFEPQHVITMRKLARQSHWHVILVDDAGQQVGFFEVENRYDLGKSLDIALSTCANMRQMDFSAAKQEIYRNYQLDDLLRT